MHSARTLIPATIKNTVETARNGLGTIYTWAAGNGRQCIHYIIYFDDY